MRDEFRGKEIVGIFVVLNCVCQVLALAILVFVYGKEIVFFFLKKKFNVANVGLNEAGNFFAFLTIDDNFATF